VNKYTYEDIECAFTEKELKHKEFVSASEVDALRERAREKVALALYDIYGKLDLDGLEGDWPDDADRILSAIFGGES
jgi:hypothetical protein